VSAYVIVDIDIHDPATYEAYKAAVPALIARHGGTYAVRGGAFEVVEGDWEPHRLVLLRFPDGAAARAFLDDPDYEPVKAIRLRSARTRLLVVEGSD